MSDREQAYTGLSMTVDGFGYLGSLVSFEPPEIKEQVEDYRGGRVAPVKMMTGYEVVEAKFKLSRDDADIVSIRAVVGRDAVITIRANADEKGSAVSTRWDVYGRIYSVETGEVKAGSVVDKTYLIAVEKFVKSIDGVPAEAFDIATGELKFGEVDVLADVRAKIGL